MIFAIVSGHGKDDVEAYVCTDCRRATRRSSPDLLIQAFVALSNGASRCGAASSSGPRLRRNGTQLDMRGNFSGVRKHCFASAGGM